MLYGINNLGKSTQAKLLVERLIKEGRQAEYLKYPIYDLQPSGPLINDFLRGGNTYKFSRRDAQFMYALNRTQYEETLKEKLSRGVNIISEDYAGTGLSWGIGSGIDEEFMRNINKHLLREDLAFLFDGKRFEQAVEKNHKFETDRELTEKVRQTHLRLGREFGWIKIDANRSIEQIHKILWNFIMNAIDPQTESQPETAMLSQANNLWEQSGAFGAAGSADTGIVGSDSVIEPIEALEFGGAETGSLVVERLTAKAKLPARAHDSDAGYDLFSFDFYSIEPGEKITMRTGVKMIIPEGYAVLIWDKSSLSQAGLHTTGGVIDSGYRGEFLINAVNLGPKAINIEHGQKIAQMLLQKVETVKIIEGKVPSDTSRGLSGFGSTGKF